MLPSGGRVIMFMTVQIREFTIPFIHVWITGTANREVHLPLTSSSSNGKLLIPKPARVMVVPVGHGMVVPVGSQ